MITGPDYKPLAAKDGEMQTAKNLGKSMFLNADNQSGFLPLWGFTPNKAVRLLYFK